MSPSRKIAYVLSPGGLTWHVGVMSVFDTAYLTDLGSKTGYHTLTGLKCLAICLFITLADSFPFTILRLPNVESGRRPIINISKFYSGLFIMVHVQIIQSEFR